MKYLDNQNQKAFDSKIPLQRTAANVMTSILLNVRNNWGSAEQQRYIKVSEEFLLGMGDAGELDFINMFVPTFLLKIIFGAKIKKTVSKYENIKNFAWEHIKEHRTTYDPEYTRDLLDIYQKEGRDKTMSEKIFINTIVDMLPDGAGTSAEAMNWAFILLAYHPEHQKRAQKRLDEVNGNHKIISVDNMQYY